MECSWINFEINFQPKLILLHVRYYNDLEREREGGYRIWVFKQVKGIIWDVV